MLGLYRSRGVSGTGEGAGAGAGAGARAGAGAGSGAETGAGLGPGLGPVAETGARPGRLLKLSTIINPSAAEFKFDSCLFYWAAADLIPLQG